MYLKEDKAYTYTYVLEKR